MRAGSACALASDMGSHVATHLMFSGNCAAALELYASVFTDFRVDAVERYEAGGPSAGQVKMAEARLGDHHLMLIDSPVPHEFTFTASISIVVAFTDAKEFEKAFEALSANGTVRMPPGDYGFSQRFAWCADRLGVSWQLNLLRPASP